MEYSFLGIILSLVFIVAFTGALLSGVGYLALANDYSTSDVFDDRIDAGGFTDNLESYEESSDSWEELSLGQGVKLYDEGEGFDVISSIKSIWNTAKSSVTMSVQFLRDVLGVPTAFTGAIFGVMIVLVILAVWKVWRAGK